MPARTMASCRGEPRGVDCGKGSRAGQIHDTARSPAQVQLPTQVPSPHIARLLCWVVPCRWQDALEHVQPRLR
jgi:hypothetical protein